MSSDDLVRVVLRAYHTSKFCLFVKFVVSRLKKLLPPPLTNSVDPERENILCFLFVWGEPFSLLPVSLERTLVMAAHAHSVSNALGLSPL